MSGPLRPLMAGAGVAALALSGIMIAAPAAGSITPDADPPPALSDSEHAKCVLSAYRSPQGNQPPKWIPVTGEVNGTFRITDADDPVVAHVNQPVSLDREVRVQVYGRGPVNYIRNYESSDRGHYGSGRVDIRYPDSSDVTQEYALRTLLKPNLSVTSDYYLVGKVPLTTKRLVQEPDLIFTETGTRMLWLTEVSVLINLYDGAGEHKHRLDCTAEEPARFATVEVERIPPDDPSTAVICAVWHLNASGRDEPVKLAEAALYGEQTANVAVNPTEVQVGERVRLTGQVDVAVQDPEFANRLDDLVSQHDTVHLLARYVRLTGTPEPDGPSAAMIALGSGGQLRYTPDETTYRFDVDDDVRAGMDLVAFGGALTEPVTLDEPGEVSFTVIGSGVVFGEADPAGARYALTCDNHTPLDLAAVTVLAQATDPGNDEESAEVDDRQQETEQLAKTGSSTVPISLTGAALLAVGAGLAIAARRRRADRVE